VEIGEIIQSELEHQNMSQRTLAELTNLSTSSLNKVIRGHRSLKDDELRLISKALNVSSDYLLGLTNIRTQLYAGNNNALEVASQIMSTVPNIETLKSDLSDHKKNFLKHGFEAIIRLSEISYPTKKG
ncbi:TPA: helix-turn-helix domain-containing protein, partial [Streptococcus suis]